LLIKYDQTEDFTQDKKVNAK